MRKKVLIDGTYALHRALYSGGKGLATPDGRPTTGSYVFLKMLWNLKDRGDVIVVFDSPGARSSFRKQVYPDYKKRPKPETSEDINRKEDFGKQLSFTYSTLKHLLPKMGIPVIVIPEQEGDDVLFKLASILDGPCDVVSDDKDYLQFLTLGNCNVYQAMKEKYFTREIFIEEFGFTPEYFCLYKSMIGDGSDNIPGVKGIGEKSATKIMKELEIPTIPALLEWANSGNKSVHEKIREQIVIAKRNLLLIDITWEPYPLHMVSDFYERSKVEVKINVKEVMEVFKDLEFKSLANWLSYLSAREKNHL